ncbi:MAG: DUF3089 domain-containing protein [Alphaproteobacteria bacterium]|nr:DUF3089 domain-containing protein [Alphaproteobacteria bacterium]
MGLSACGAKTEAPETAAAFDPVAATDGDEAALKPVEPADYSDKANWLCRPDMPGPCQTEIDATVVAPDGKLTKEPFAPAADPPIDCFYVYPTTSLDPTPNADMTPGPEEAAVVVQQLARFGAVCRLYAPLYRQVSVPALLQMLDGKSPETNREMAYADVKAAWERYLANDNAGRGVVLIGHDQGAGVLIRLIANEIDGKPVEDRIVSAILPGANLSVAAGQGVGGSFKTIKLCTSSEDLGCAIGWSSFRADKPPPADSFFGAADDKGMEIACVNPADLDGSGGALKAYLPAARVTGQGQDPPEWTTTGEPIETRFVRVPGLLSAKCVSQDGFNYLAVTTNGDPTDARTDAIAGDLIIGGKVQPAWGLHLYDMSLVMGNLVGLVKTESAAYAARAAQQTKAPPEDH